MLLELLFSTKTRKTEKNTVDQISRLRNEIQKLNKQVDELRVELVKSQEMEEEALRLAAERYRNKQEEPDDRYPIPDGQKGELVREEEKIEASIAKLHRRFNPVIHWTNFWQTRKKIDKQHARDEFVLQTTRAKLQKIRAKIREMEEQEKQEIRTQQHIRERKSSKTLNSQRIEKEIASAEAILKILQEELKILLEDSTRPRKR